MTQPPVFASAQRRIQSRDNPLYKRVLRLQQDGGFAARERRKGQASVVLEGVHLCQMWLQHRGQPELALFDDAALAGNAEVAALCDQVERQRGIGLEPALARALSQVEHGPGVFFLVSAPQGADAMPEAACVLWLDRVQDPGNVGTLLRTAAAAGMTHACLSAGCASAWSSKALRAGQGAQLSMSLHEDADLLGLRAGLRVPLVATALTDAQPLFAASLPDPCVWVFGHEGQGVAPALLDAADLRVFIPQSSGVESLNVAAAAAVCLFEQRRRRG